jgi:diadenosine tetraphosphatase ApaH/serine/threonine PP2A family protein phosphatase
MSDLSAIAPAHDGALGLQIDAFRFRAYFITHAGAMKSVDPGPWRDSPVGRPSRIVSVGRADKICYPGV